MDKLKELQEIVEERQYKDLKFTDGKMRIDLLTAQLMLKVYSVLSPKAQEKFRELINSNRNGFYRMQKFCYENTVIG